MELEYKHRIKVFSYKPFNDFCIWNHVHILPILKTNKIKVPNNLETKAEHALAGVKKVTETSWFSHNSGGVQCDP